MAEESKKDPITEKPKTNTITEDSFLQKTLFGFLVMVCE